MAVITKIRNKAGLLVSIVIGIALLAFILGDFLSNRQVSFSGRANDVASVNRQRISHQEFALKVAEMENIYKSNTGTASLTGENAINVRNETFKNMVETIILEDQYNKLSLSVTPKEMMDLINGDTPHPIIMQLFADPQTGVLNRVNLHNFLVRMNEEEENPQKQAWQFYEDMIYNQRQISKYNNLISKGLYATNLEADQRKQENEGLVDISYIVKNFNEVVDSNLTVDEQEIRKYYKDNKANYAQKASIDLQYALWAIVPSEQDRKDASAWIDQMKKPFADLDPATTPQYVNLNSDVDYDFNNYAKGELPSNLDEFAFSAELGDVYGPYTEGESFRLAKLSNIEYLPDSVRASHILLDAQAGQAAFVIADSLKNLIENGANFASLAQTHSTDRATPDGDLGWFQEGDMVKSFSDSCFYSETGDVKIVFSQFGIHIIKVTNQSRKTKKVQVGVLARNITASDATDQHYYNEASKFRGINKSAEAFVEALKNQEGFRTEQARMLEKDAIRVNNIEESRALIQWGFNSDEGTISPVTRYGDYYVVAIVNKKRDNGFADLADVEGDIRLTLEKEKKGAMLAQQLNEAASNANSIDDLASKLGKTVETATNLRFTSYSLPTAMDEQAVIASAHHLEEGKLSKAIIGKNGVYVITVDQKSTVDSPLEENTMEKSYIERTYSAAANASTMNVLKELTRIKDNRTIMY